MVLIHQNIGEDIILLLLWRNVWHVQERKHGEAQDHDEQDEHEGSQFPNDIDEVLTHGSCRPEESEHLQEIPESTSYHEVHAPLQIGPLLKDF